MKGTIKSRLENIATGGLELAYASIKDLKFSKRYFNNIKVEDHNAIIPTVSYNLVA